MSEGGTRMDSITAGLSERVWLVNELLFCGQGWQETGSVTDCLRHGSGTLNFAIPDECSCLWLIILAIQPLTQIKRMTSLQMLQQKSKGCGAAAQQTEHTRLNLGAISALNRLTMLPYAVWLMMRN